MDKKYLQYGCGFSNHEEWRNFDSSPTLYMERLPLLGGLIKKNESRFPDNVEFGDIIKGLPVDNNYLKGVYCSHVLEHLALSDFRIALKKTYDILEKDGIFRLVLPDLEYEINKYVNNTEDTASLDFLRNTSLGEESRSKGFKGLIYSYFGNSKHLWMWDYKSIKKELENIGFKKIRRAYYDDSIDRKFKQIESEERWENSLGLECQK